MVLLLSLPFQVLCSNLSTLAKHGYAVVEETYVDGEFKGCEYDRKIIFQNRRTFTCRTYSYSYSYHPEVHILKNVRNGDIKVLINDQEYYGLYSGQYSSDTMNYLSQIEVMDRETARLNAETAAMQQQIAMYQADEKLKEELRRIWESTPAAPAEPEFKNTQEALNAAAVAIYKIYPFLDINNSKANKDAIETVRVRTKEYVDAGYTWVDSLVNAVNDVGPLFDIKNKKVRKNRVKARQ